MLLLIPSAAYGRLGAVLSALIVCASLIGLTMHPDFYAGVLRRHFYCFYTNLSNLLVLVYFSLAAPRLYARAALRPLIPHAEFAVMMSIMLTFCVFHTMIYPAVSIAARQAERTREFFILLVNNIIVHYLVPWLVFAYWLLCSPGKKALGAEDALYWTLLPALYLLVILAGAKKRGKIKETGSPYPYPFLDVQALGARRVAGVCTMLYAVCTAAGLSLIGVLRFLILLFGPDHAFFLV